MSFGLIVEGLIDPDEPEPVECHYCRHWEPCPCGCGKGWCSFYDKFTDELGGCDE